ncbi:MAG: hypothetical protein K8W52_05490 [Deltaproteobacteria bacterium]|nr:hypothetical protein [Deltaproteobacteria bacterium]
MTAASDRVWSDLTAISAWSGRSIVAAGEKEDARGMPDDREPMEVEAAEVERVAAAPVAHPDDDLPVVARLMVEIRSDGRRTVARGAVENTATGERVAIEARGDSPIQLAMALAKSLWQPVLGARSVVRGLLGRKKR